MIYLGMEDRKGVESWGAKIMLKIMVAVCLSKENA
jgi:hypothetical protein